MVVWGHDPDSDTTISGRENDRASPWIPLAASLEDLLRQVAVLEADMTTPSNAQPKGFDNTQPKSDAAPSRRQAPPPNSRRNSNSGREHPAAADEHNARQALVGAVDGDQTADASRIDTGEPVSCRSVRVKPHRSSRSLNSDSVRSLAVPYMAIIWTSRR